jgi:D-alanine--poly(phosphoribitol) ligase subunit 1
MAPSLTGDPGTLALHRRINATDVPYPQRAVPELFLRRAARYAGSPAVVDGDRTLRYGDLEGLSAALAGRLWAAGVRPGDTVAVRLERSAELVVALLAVLRCGAAYLPCDPGWPAERVRRLRELAGCRHEVGPAEVAGLRPGGTAPDPPVHPDATAYVMFTSGTTGVPKGVPIRHRGIVRLVHGARYARLDASSVLLQLAPAAFDASTFEIWGALLHGGTCVLHPERHLRLSTLHRVLRDSGVTVVFLTTALFNTIVDEAPDVLDPVRTVLTGGEAHSLRHVAAALDRYGPDKLVSVYGPTECTTFATFHPVRRLDPALSALPLGRPIQNTRLYVAAGDRLCHPGEIGEILLAGPGLSPGYLGPPEAAADRFVQRAADGRAERLYRTGDRAWLRPDGDVVFAGRVDDQVKIDGHRIELGEVTHHLGGHPQVKQCYVTVAESAAGQRRLLAWVVPAGERCTAAGLRRFLAQRLPAYMVPGALHLTGALPLTGTGKVDRSALLAADPP